MPLGELPRKRLLLVLACLASQACRPAPSAEGAAPAVNATAPPRSAATAITAAPSATASTATAAATAVVAPAPACVVNHPSFSIEGESPPEIFVDWLALARTIAPSIASTAKNAGAARTALCAASDVSCQTPICTADAALVWSRAAQWMPVLVLMRDDGKLVAWTHASESIWGTAYCDGAACSIPPTLRYAKSDRRVHLSFVDRAAAKAGCFDTYREEEWILDGALLRRARVLALTEMETSSSEAPAARFPGVEVASDGTVTASLPGCPAKVRPPRK